MTTSTLTAIVETCNDPRVHAEHLYQTRSIVPLEPVGPVKRCPGREEWKR